MYIYNYTVNIHIHRYISCVSRFIFVPPRVLYPTSLYDLSVCMSPPCVCPLHIYVSFVYMFSLCAFCAHVLSCVCPSICMSPPWVCSLCAHSVYVLSVCMSSLCAFRAHVLSYLCWLAELRMIRHIRRSASSPVQNCISGELFISWPRILHIRFPRQVDPSSGTCIRKTRY